MEKLTPEAWTELFDAAEALVSGLIRRLGLSATAEGARLVRATAAVRDLSAKVTCTIGSEDVAP